MTGRLSPAVGLVAGLYLLLLAALIGGLVYLRGQVLAELGTTQAKAEWQAWKEEVEQEQGQTDLPVRRRPPKSDEPPWLFLMRDHFGTIVFFAILVFTLLYAFLAFVTRGVLSSKQATQGPDA